MASKRSSIFCAVLDVADLREGPKSLTLLRERVLFSTHLYMYILENLHLHDILGYIPDIHVDRPSLHVK